jgi:O-antigen/teichoic acid export membrane protein
MAKLKKNIFFNILLNVINILYPVLSFPYVARVLGPSGIGKVQFVTTLALYFTLIAALGVPIYGIREIAKVRSEKLALSKTFSELFMLNVVSSLAMLLVYLITIQLPYFQNGYSFFFFGSIIVLFGPLSIDWFYQGIEEFNVIAIRSFIVKFAAIILLYAFVKTKDDGTKYLLISIFSIVGNSILNVGFVRSKVRLTFENLNFKRHLRPLLLIFGFCLATSMYTMLDVVLLGFLSNDTVLGYYTAGVKLVKVSIPFVTAIGVALMPRISKDLQEKNLENFYFLIRKSFDFISLISIPACALMYLYSYELINLFSGKAFEKAIPTMQILSILPLIIGFGYLYGIQILVASGRDKQILISVTAGMFISVFLNFLLIPLLGQNGAALSNVVCECAVTLLYLYFVKKSFEIRRVFFLKPLVGSAISCLPFIPFVYLSRMLFGNELPILLFAVPLSITSYTLVQYLIFKNQFICMMFDFLFNFFEKSKRFFNS